MGFGIWAAAEQKSTDARVCCFGVKPFICNFSFDLLAEIFFIRRPFCVPVQDLLDLEDFANLLEDSQKALQWASFETEIWIMNCEMSFYCSVGGLKWKK